MKNKNRTKCEIWARVVGSNWVQGTHKDALGHLFNKSFTRERSRVEKCPNASNRVLEGTNPKPKQKTFQTTAPTKK